MKLFIINRPHHVRITLMTLRSVGQKSTSASDCQRNLVNSIALEPLKEFEPKLAQIFSAVGQRTDLVLKVVGSKVKVT